MNPTTSPAFVPPPEPTGPTALNGRHRDDGPPRFVDGVEVVAIEQAVAAPVHPTLGDQLVPIKNVAKALLADGTEVYLCDGVEECDYHADTINSVTAHRSHHTERNASGSMYSDEILRVVIKAAKLAQRTGSRRWANEAADALNQAGVRTIRGVDWTGAAVAHVVRTFGSKVSVRLPGPGRPAGVKDGEGRGAAKIQAKLLAELAAASPDHAGLVLELNDLQTEVERVASRVGKLLTRVEAGDYFTVTDPALAAKAAKWDQMQALMGGGS